MKASGPAEVEGKEDREADGTAAASGPGRLVRAVAFCSAAYLLTFNSAPAQTLALNASAARKDDAAPTSTMLVTARRRDELAQNVPIPIITLDGDRLDRDGTWRIEDLGQQFPSANFQFLNPRQTSFAVRGLGNNPANDALESSVGIYLDDIYLGRPGMADVDLVDIDRVSLFAGPQGTLFGKNTTAGVVDIHTRAPTAYTESGAELSIGSDDHYRGAGYVSGALLGDALMGRLAVAKSHQDGFVHSIANGNDYNGYDRDGIRGQLLYVPGPTLSLRLIADYSHEHSNCCASALYSLGPKARANAVAITDANGQVTVVPPPATPVYLLPYYAGLAGAIPPTVDPGLRTTTGGDHGWFKLVNQGGASAEMNWLLPTGYRLTSITAYRSWGFDPGNEEELSIDAYHDAGFGDDDKQFSQELRIASPDHRSIEYVAGLYYFFQNQDDVFHIEFGPDAQNYLQAPAFDGAVPPLSLNDLTSDTRSTLTTDSTAAFAQLTWHATSHWNLSAGLRETYESKAAGVSREAPTRGGRNVPASQVPASLAAYDSGPLSQHDYDLSALASIDYQLDPGMMLYASIARGAKSGGINPMVPPQDMSTGSWRTGSLFIAPEKADDIELGFKSLSWHRHLLFNAGLFRTLVKDYQTTQLIQVSPGVYSETLQNAGYVRTQGIETQVHLALVRGLTWTLAGSYDDAQYKSYYNAPCPAESPPTPSRPYCNLTGAQVVGAPRWIVNTGLRLNGRLTGNVFGYGIAEYAWRSSDFGAADDSLYSRIPAYGIANFRAGVDGSLADARWDLSIWARNAFDKHYVLGGLDQDVYNDYYETPGQPRIVGATLRIDF